MDYSYLGLFVPWTVRTVLGLFVPWTLRTVDCSYLLGLFVPWTIRTLLELFVPWTVRTVLGLFVPSWTVRTVDCSYPPGLFVPWTIRTITGRFVPWCRLTKINVSYQNVPVFSVCQTPLNFSDIFPKRLGLFSPNFTFRLYIHIYAGLQVFITVRRYALHGLCVQGTKSPRTVRTVHGTNSPRYE